MKLFPVRYTTLAVLTVLFLLAGCKQPETVVVNRNPTTVADTSKDQQTNDDATFRKLAIGEYQPIRSLDPLFADNASAMRAVQLLYEGLVRLDADGSVVSGLAESWEVENDSLTYTFKLRSDVYYQDSDIFSTGTGRRMNAADIKYVFERMAKAEVPPNAAQLFMNIQGFDSYYQEQRLVYHPKERNLSGISGIKTPNEQTVVFQLENPDPHFLQKLATPLAVIYPREAVGQTVDAFTPVGAGPFTFSRRTSDSTLIVSKFQNYYDASDIDINRIDIRPSTSESELFKAMSSGELHLLPQLGPQLMQSNLDNDGNLAEAYRERYDLQNPGGEITYNLRHNSSANLSAESARNIAQLLTADSASYFEKFPGNLVTGPATDTTDTTFQSTDIDTQIYSVYSDDPFVRTFMGSLSEMLANYDISLQMSQIRAPTKNTALFVTSHFPLIPNDRWSSYEPLVEFTVQQLALQRSEIKALNFNQYPWWFDIRGVTLPAEENLN